jgi:hypothetical protein
MDFAILNTIDFGGTLMARLRLDIRNDSYERLIQIAVQERRPVDWQAEVILMRAIDEYFLPMLRLESAEVEPANVQEQV